MLPQLDVKFFCSQLFWLFIAFGMLYFYLGKFALPRLYVIFKLRKKDLSEAKHNNEELLAKAQGLEVKYQSELNAMKIETSEVLRKTEINLRKNFNLVKKESENDFKLFMRDIEDQLTEVIHTSELDKLGKIDENKDAHAMSDSLASTKNLKTMDDTKVARSPGANGKDSADLSIEDRIAASFLNRVNREYSSEDNGKDGALGGSNLFLGTILFKKIFKSRL